MILVDTSVWVEPLRHGSARLRGLLLGGQVLAHPFVIGELACGWLEPREQVLALLRQLPQAEQAEEEEVLAFIDRHRLYGCGLGWIDVHLLASTLLSRATLWTHDRRLARAAARLNIGA